MRNEKFNTYRPATPGRFADPPFGFAQEEKVDGLLRRVCTVALRHKRSLAE